MRPKTLSGIVGQSVPFQAAHDEVIAQRGHGIGFLPLSEAGAMLDPDDIGLHGRPSGRLLANVT
jgi:hypothetical protein